MKKQLLILLLMLFVSAFAFGQNSPAPDTNVYKNWTFLVESPKHIDVYHRILNCNGKKQIHLRVANDSPNDQVVHFDLEITNIPSGDKFTKEVKFNAQSFKSFMAECTSEETLPYLKIDLPEKYYHYGLSLKVTFRE